MKTRFFPWYISVVLLLVACDREQNVIVQPIHPVPLITEGLPTGSYVLQLVYAEQKLAVPVEVQ